MINNKYLTKSEIRECIIFHGKFDLSLMRESIEILEKNNELDDFFYGEDKNLLLLATSYKNIEITKLLLEKNINVENINVDVVDSN